MLRELFEEKETACASSHANGQERANVDNARMHHVFFCWCHTPQDTAAVSARRAYESGVPPHSTSLKGIKDSQPTRRRDPRSTLVHLFDEREDQNTTSPSRRATHRGPAGASELGRRRRREACDGGGQHRSPRRTLRPLRSSRRAARFTRGKAASRATRPGKPSRIPTEQKCPQSNSSGVVGGLVACEQLLRGPFQATRPGK